MKGKKRIRLKWYEVLLIGALMGIVICCAAWIVSYFGQMHASRQAFEKLAQTVHAAVPADAPEDAQAEAQQKSVLELQAQNPDCLAWLYSADMGLDYPIMYTPQQPEYYLRKNFEKQYSLAGTPFLDARSTSENSANLIVHGHNMKDGSMFAPLGSCLDDAYEREHVSFELTFADGVRRYALLAVLHVELTAENVDKYYCQPQSQEEFEAFINLLKRESIYYSDADGQGGEQLLTLSTCDNRTDNGRILVVALRVK